MAKGKAELQVDVKTKGDKKLGKINQALKKISKFAAKAAAAYALTTAAIIKFGQKGSKILDIQDAFTSLARSQGQDAKQILNSMREASRGTISDLKLMEQANQALLLGLPVERFGDMLKIARSSAKATGQSMDFMLNSIVIGVGRSSKLVLDNLGIIIDTNKAYEEYAAKVGIATNKLTDFQKKQAFTNKALEIGLANAKNTGSEALSVGEKFQQLKTQVANATNVIMTLFVPAFNEVISTSKSMVKVFSDIANSDAMVNVAKVGTKAFVKLNIAIEGVTAVMVEKLRPLFEALPSFISGKFSKALKLIKKDTKSVSEIVIEQRKILNDRLLEVDKQFDARKAVLTKQSSEKELKSAREASELQRILKAEDAQLAKDMEAFRKEEETEEKRLFNEQIKLLENKAQLDRINQEIRNATTRESKMAALDKKALLREALINKQRKVEASALHKFKQFLQSEELKGLQGTLNQISGLQDSSSKEAVFIGKAAAIASITISTARAAMDAYAWGFHFGGPVLATAFTGLALAAGAIQVGKVAGVALADGGIVEARPGGIQATIGEGGVDEAVIPLDDAGGGLGSTINITVNGGMLGDEQSAREFAEVVDQRLLELRQDNASVAFDRDVI